MIIFSQFVKMVQILNPTKYFTLIISNNYIQPVFNKSITTHIKAHLFIHKHTICTYPKAHLSYLQAYSLILKQSLMYLSTSTLPFSQPYHLSTSTLTTLLHKHTYHIYPKAHLPYLSTITLIIHKHTYLSTSCPRTSIKLLSCFTISVTLSSICRKSTFKICCRSTKLILPI